MDIHNNRGKMRLFILSALLHDKGANKGISLTGIKDSGSALKQSLFSPFTLYCQLHCFGIATEKYEPWAQEIKAFELSSVSTENKGIGRARYCYQKRGEETGVHVSNQLTQPSKKTCIKPSLVAYAYNANTQEMQTEGLISAFKACLDYIVSLWCKKPKNKNKKIL